MQKLTAFVQGHVTAHQTAQVLFWTICLLLSWEAFVLVFKIPHATISEVSWAYLRQYPWLEGALCFVLGHILWQSAKAFKIGTDKNGKPMLVPIEPNDYKNEETTNEETTNDKKKAK